MSGIRWGIAATGKIAARFTDGLSQVDDAEVVAVGSRAQASADAFGDRWGIARRHASLDALAADPDVDVVYVASPHAAHHDDALRFLAPASTCSARSRSHSTPRSPGAWSPRRGTGACS